MTQLTFNVRAGVKKQDLNVPQIPIPQFYAFQNRNIQVHVEGAFNEDSNRNLYNSVPVTNFEYTPNAGGNPTTYKTISLRSLLNTNIFKLDSVSPPINVADVTHIKLIPIGSNGQITNEGSPLRILVYDDANTVKISDTAVNSFTTNYIELSKPNTYLLLLNGTYDPLIAPTFITGSETKEVLADYAMGDNRKKRFLQTLFKFQLGNATKNIWSTEAYINLDHSSSFESVSHQIGSAVHKQ